MPTRARSFGRSVLGSLTLMPSRMISPLWNGSSALTHLIKVDFPEPEGPHTTTTSPLATSVLQSFSTWKLPYHLLRCLMEIMYAFFSRGSSDDRDPVLQLPHAIRGSETDQEVYNGDEHVHLDQPIVAI